MTARRITLTIALLLAGLAATAPGAHAKPWCSNAGSERLGTGKSTLWYGGLGWPVGPGSVGRTEACFRLWSGGWGPYRCAYSHLMRY
jgi:hypothetical protein